MRSYKRRDVVEKIPELKHPHAYTANNARNHKYLSCKELWLWLYVFFPISANVRRDGLVVGLNWGIACHLSHYTGDLCMISGSRQSRQGQWWMTSQEERRIWYILGYHREGMSTWHIVNYLKHGHTCSKVSPNSVSEKWPQQLYLLIYHNLFLALLWNIQKHLLNNDNELALSVEKNLKLHY